MSRQPHAPAAFPRDKIPDTHYTGDWVGPRAGLDVLKKGQDCFPCPESNLGSSSTKLLVMPTEISRLPKNKDKQKTRHLKILPNRHSASEVMKWCGDGALWRLRITYSPAMCYSTNLLLSECRANFHPKSTWQQQQGRVKTSVCADR
jgi:hypothetical protein